MSDQHEQARQLYEAEEVFDVVFPARDESAVVLHPCEDSLDLPSAPVAPQPEQSSCIFSTLAIRILGCITLVAHSLQGSVWRPVSEL